MSVNLVRKVRLLVGAAAAKPGPAIGQALGPLGKKNIEYSIIFIIPIIINL